jgi:threonine/homoserine/homoserine lactone efflux protein
MTKKNINRMAWLKCLSGLSVNLSAAYFALAILAPNFSGKINSDSIASLTFNIIAGIFFLLLGVELEKISVKYA